MANRDRFKDLPFVDKASSIDVLLIGLGGIGSWTVIPVAKIGYKLHLYDDDRVEQHNLGGQNFDKKDINLFKVSAIQSKLYNLEVNNATTYIKKFTNEDYISAVTIMGVDNMATRKLAFEKWVEYTKISDEPCIFIDGRMEAEVFQVYSVLPKNIERYRETLFDDSEIEEAPCSAKATTHCAMKIGSTITDLLTNFTVNIEDDCRILPFLTTYNIPLLDYEIQM